MRRGRSTSKRSVRYVAVLVGLVGAGLCVFAFTRPASAPRAPNVGAHGGESSQAQQQHPASASERRSSGAAPAGVEDRITGPVLPAAQPLDVAIPRLDVASPLVRLGRDDQGAMEVPRDPATAGWYHLGPAPGALGPAVIAGHVTWNQVPAVFFRLAELRQGDVVKVTRADDQVAVFEVTQVTTYAKSHFPTRAVFGGIDHAGLRLITCGGEFDRSSARYSDNVVAFATLVSTHRTGNPHEHRSEQQQGQDS